MSDIDVNKIQQNVKELQDQNSIDFQQWKKLTKIIEKLSEKIKLSDTNLNMLMKKIKNDYEKLKKIIVYENVQVQLNNKIEKNKNGKLVLVTAISPTPLGEGKTTVSIAIADGLSRIGKKSILALREPSLGPVFGIKGGATGGGYVQVAPMEDINLHFTGDIHGRDV